MFKVRVRTLSGAQCCWALPDAATFWHVQVLVKAEFGVKLRNQQLVVARAPVAGKSAAARFAEEGILDCTLVVVSSRACEWCGAPGVHRTCAGCRSTFYCSRECQRQAWRGHRVRCSQIVLSAAEVASKARGLGAPS